MVSVSGPVQRRAGSEGGEGAEREGGAGVGLREALLPDESTALLPEGSGRVPKGGTGAGEESYGERRKGLKQLSLGRASLAMANTTLGCGVMALPYVFKNLGIAMGVLFLFLGMWVTGSSMGDLIWSANFMNLPRYPDLVTEVLGRRHRQLFNVAMIVNNLGVLAVYLHIMGDVLSGDAEVEGAIPRFTAGRGGFLIGRYFVQGAATVVVLAPLCLLRKIEALARFSDIFLSLVLTFCGISLVLGGVYVVKVWEGKLHMPQPPRIIPTADEFEPDALFGAIRLFTMIPILLNSFICHYNILPIQQAMKPEVRHRVMDSIWKSLISCTVLYSFVASALYLAYGHFTRDDVLLNFNDRGKAEEVLGTFGADLIQNVVPCAYVASLMITFPFINYTLRELCKELAPGREGTVKHAGVTLALLLVVYLVSVLVKDVKTILSVSGSTATVLIGFYFPPLLRLRLEMDYLTSLQKARIYGLLIMGGVIAVVTVAGVALGAA